MSLRLYLARHGETDWNLEGRMQGGTDVPLNPTGHEQARALASRLAHLVLDHIYVSALRRSQLTAAAFSGNIARTVLPELNERRMGAYEGVRLADLPEAERERFKIRRFMLDDDLDGGESLLELLARARRVLSTVRERHLRGNILLVGHGALNAVMLTELYGRPPGQVADLHIGNGDVFEVVMAEPAPLVTKL